MSELSRKFEDLVVIIGKGLVTRKELEDAKITARNKAKSARATPPRGRSFADVYGTNKCLFWDCTRSIREDHFLCHAHFEDLQDGLIDECKGCGLAKDIQYDLCLNCVSERPTSPRPRKPASRPKYTWYKEEYSPAWAKGDKTAPYFFVYILKLSDGTFYAGQTRELRERLMEHRDNQVSSTKSRNPKLVWFATIPSRNAATKLEAELKKLIATNPREVRRMITTLKDYVKELDYS